MSSCVPPPAQSRWPLPVCTRRRALAALSALEVFSPAHATAGGVDGAPVDAVVVVPGGRLVAANVHDWVQGGAERRRAKRRSLIENDPGPGRALLWQREATKRNGPSAMPWAGPLYSMQRADRLQCVRIRPWPSSAAVQQCSITRKVAARRWIRSPRATPAPPTSSSARAGNAGHDSGWLQAGCRLRHPLKQLVLATGRWPPVAQWSLAHWPRKRASERASVPGKASGSA